MRGTPAFLLALLLLPASLAAQTVRLEGPTGGRAARALKALLDRGDYVVVSRDTILGDSVHIRSDLVVNAATVRISGQVDGSIAVIEGTLFLRPGARVGGQIISTPGSLVLPSAKATYGDTLSVPLTMGVALSRAADSTVVTLVPPPAPPLLSPGGLFGLQQPTYDRVNGATVRASVNFQPFGAIPNHVYAQAWGTYYSARGAVGGGVRAVVPFEHDVVGRAEVARETRTNERWIRGDFANSLAALVARSDARDYWESDYATVTLEKEPPALQTDQAFAVPRLTLLVERDRSLAARNPWSVLHGGEPWRTNPPVAEGTLASATLGAALGWRGTLASFDGDAAVEWAPASVGDFSFAQLTASGEWSMFLFSGHMIDVRAHLLQPLGGGGAPPQRWSSVGGAGTLPTLDFDALRGDHVVFIQSTYAIAVPRLSIPLVGPPIVAFRDAIGTAWVTGEDAPRWAQNVAVGLQFRALEAFAYIDPARPGPIHPTLTLALALSF
ncbi:MAG TPA: polymer-forming cytoskeletal protein [Longimicrobiaceae bacterium]|nr:polymer-forming cytoskeletal protein [Longimicrobiaceae bacterium]